MALNGKSKSKRPKFLLGLKINELINIPQSAGVCYVRWHLKDGTGTSGRKAAEDVDGTVVSHQSKGHTAKVPVRQHKAQWNYHLDKPVEVKLHVDKGGDLVGKILKLEVVFEFLSGNEGVYMKVNGNNSSSTTTTTSSNSIVENNKKKVSPHGSSGTSVNEPHKVAGKLLLGTANLNIADYVREDETEITNRFLLRNSKINSIINVSVQMQLVRGTYDDFKIPKNFTSGQLPGSFHTGIGDILDDSSDITSPASTAFGSKFKTSTPSHAKSSNHSSSNNTSSSMSPLVDELYQKTFKLPWDPRPGEYTPRECVEDILRGGNGWAKNEKGINLIDLQALSLEDQESNYYETQKTLSKNTEDDLATSGGGNSVPISDYYNLGKREFLEKRKESNKRGSLMKTEDHDDEFNSEEFSQEEFYAGKIRDARSWSVNTIKA